MKFFKLHNGAGIRQPANLWLDKLASVIKLKTLLKMAFNPNKSFNIIFKTCTVQCFWHEAVIMLRYNHVLIIHIL